jgi:hypothetical protein
MMSGVNVESYVLSEETLTIICSFVSTSLLISDINNDDTKFLRNYYKQGTKNQIIRSKLFSILFLKYVDDKRRFDFLLHIFLYSFNESQKINENNSKHYLEVRSEKKIDLKQFLKSVPIEILSYIKSKPNELFVVFISNYCLHR